MNYKSEDSVPVASSFLSPIENFDSASEIDKFAISDEIVNGLYKYGARVLEDNQVVKVIEKILFNFPNPIFIVRIFKTITKDIEFIINSKYASNLLEKILFSCQFEDVANDSLVRKVAGQFNEYMWLHYPDYLEHNIGSHIVRTWLQFMSGCYIDMDNNPFSMENIKICVPMEEDSSNKLRSLANRFLFKDTIKTFITSRFTSSFCQVLLVLYQKLIGDESINKLMEMFCNVSLEKQKNKVDDLAIPDSFNDPYKGYFIECLLKIIPDCKIYQNFLKKYLRGTHLSVFLDASLNNPNCCAILRLILSRENSTQALTKIMEILHKKSTAKTDTDDSIVNFAFMHILITLIKKIPKFTEAEHQYLRTYKHNITEIIQHMCKSKEGYSSLSIFLSRKLVNDKSDGESDYDKQTSLVLQTVLQYFDPIPKSINKLFTDINSKDLKVLCNDPKSIRVLEEYIQSKYVNANSKLGLITKMTEEGVESLFEWACHKHCSRLFDKVFDMAKQSTNPEDKYRSMFCLLKENLRSKEKALRMHYIGKFIYYKYFGYSSKSIDGGNDNGNNSNRSNNRNDKNHNKSHNGNKNNKRNQKPTPEHHNKKRKVQN